MDELEIIMKAYIEDFIEKSNNSKLRKYIVPNSIPIIWFGNMERYFESQRKIVTIGLNPSKEEFSEKRFNDISFDDINKSIKDLKTTLNQYFGPPHNNPYKKWFNNGNIALEPMKASYYDNNPELHDVALHIDIYTAIATDPTWGKLDEEIKKALDNTDLFQKLLKYLEPDIILVSVNKDVFEKNFGFDYIKDNEKYQYESRGDTSSYYIRKYHKEKGQLFWIYNNRGTAFGLEHDFMKKSIEKMLSD